MADRRFDDRMKQLDRKVGRGKLTASVVVDQVYARFQHERLDLQHPNGGGAKYLYKALMGNYRDYLMHITPLVLRGNLQNGMFRNAQFMAVEVMWEAPVEFGDLRRSGQPRLLEGEAVRMQKPPIQRRLTEAELRVKSRQRYALSRVGGV